MKSVRDKFFCAFRGMTIAIKDKSILFQIIAMIVTIIVFSFLSLSIVEWCIIFACCALVIIAEFANTAMERILDFVQPDYDEKVKDIKDLGAAMVLFACIVAVIIGLLIVGNHVL